MCLQKKKKQLHVEPGGAVLGICSPVPNHKVPLVYFNAIEGCILTWVVLFHIGHCYFAVASDDL